MPPKGIDLSRMLIALEGVRGRVDGINVPDMPSADMRSGSRWAKVFLTRSLDVISQVIVCFLLDGEVLYRNPGLN